MSRRPRYHGYTPLRDYETLLPVIREESDMMSESTILPPRLPSKNPSRNSSRSTTKTSRAREVRSHATSWAQEADDEYELVEKPVSMPSVKKSNKPLKWFKKAVQMARDVSTGKEKEADRDEHAFLGEPVDVEEELLKDREGMQVRYGGDAVEDGDDPFGDFYEVDGEADQVVKAPAAGSAGRRFRDRF